MASSFSFGPAGRMTAAFYVALFAMLGAHLPFWPVWMHDWGLSEAEVGWWLTLAIAARVLAGIAAPWLADASGKRRLALALLALSGALVFWAHGWAESRATLLALTLLSAFALAGTIPLGDALAAAAARRHGFAYAPVRAVGSAAFLLANLAVGWAMARWGSEAARWWIILWALALAALAMRHPGGARGADAPRATLAQTLPALKRRDVLLAALASAAIQGSHAPLYAYGSLQWRAQGVSDGEIGALWAVGVAVETLLMFAFGARLTERLGAAGMFALAAGVSLIRWLAMAAAPTGAALWLLQISHAITFAPAHLALIAFISISLPPAIAASAQGLNAAGIGLGTALATALAAQIYPSHGATAFLVGAVWAAVGLAAALALWRGDQGSPGAAFSSSTG